MNIDITRERLLELGSSLDEIMQELSTAVDAPGYNRKKRNHSVSRKVHYMNLIDNQKLGVKRKIKIK